MSMSTCPRATDQSRTPSSPSISTSLVSTSSHPPYQQTTASYSQSSVSTTAFHPQSREARPLFAAGYSVPRSQAYPETENAARYNASINPGNDFDYQQPKHPQLSAQSSAGGTYPISLPPPPPPTLPLPSIAASPGPMLSLNPQLPPLPLPPPISQSAENLRRLSSSPQPMGGRPPTASSNMGMSLIGGGGRGAGRFIYSPSRRNSNSDPTSSRPQTSHSRKSSQSSVQQSVGNTMQRRRGSGGPKSNATKVKEEAASSHTLSPTVSKTTPSPSATGQAITSSKMPVAIAAPAPPKSKRVRTGCLTCRERHLKCDEGTPNCLNCRKGNRECKRGLRLNFIDIQTRPIPYAPPIAEWNVSFYDESRHIASEYAGGVGKYPRVKDGDLPPPPRLPMEVRPSVKRRRSSAIVEKSNNSACNASSSLSSTAQFYPVNTQTAQNLQNISESASSSRNASNFPIKYGQSQLVSTANTEAYSSYARKEEEPGEKKHAYQGSDASSIASSMVPQGVGGPSSAASFKAEVGNSPEDENSRVAGRHSGDIGHAGHLNDTVPEGLPTPPSEKTGILRGGSGAGGGGVGGGGAAVPAPVSGHGPAGAFEDICGATSNNGEREYLNSADEVLFMQVFVEEVGVWMDSLDRDKHFSRIIPFVALKSPMMLNAFLACGAKHLTLVNEAYKDDKALFYYDTATTQLLRSLQNPDRDIVECATTAVVLNVYEIMSEKPNERMNHIAGARALIRECGWDARSKGIGAACFWLNIGMEVLSCLTFNFRTAWDPDQWGLDTSFAHSPDDNNEASTAHDRRDSQQQDRKMSHAGPVGCTVSSRKSQHDAEASTSKSSELEPTTTAVALSAISSSTDEEMWVHRIFYIVAKIADFRASYAVFPQEVSPIDHQIQMQKRFEEWKRLKRLCAIWNRDCPRSMRPFSYLFPSESTGSVSIFPNIWLIERTAVIGRLFYHTAMVLLHQVNPDEPKESIENQDAQRHHAHQVCGIVAHTKDRGVASVAICSLAISAQVLRDPQEQDEVYVLLKKITAETGWRIGKIYAELQQVWGREIKDTTGQPPQSTTLAAVSSSPSTLLPPPTDLPPPASLFTQGFGQLGPGLVSSSGLGSGSAPPPMHKIDFNTSASPMPPSSSGDGRRSLPVWPTSNTSTMLNIHNRHLHGMPTTTTQSSLASSSQSPPSASAPTPFRPPHMSNPLMHADFRLPDHPYKAFYKPPNDSAHLNSQSF